MTVKKYNRLKPQMRFHNEVLARPEDFMVRPPDDMLDLLGRLDPADIVDTFNEGWEED